MNTEITDKEINQPKGWIFYDGECALCLRWMRRTEGLLKRGRFKFVPFQTGWASGSEFQIEPKDSSERSAGLQPALDHARAKAGCKPVLRSEVRVLAPTEMRLLLANGKIFGGADAVMEIARQIWWAWPSWLISKIPGVILFLRAIYRFIARHRNCGNKTCGITNRKTWLDWIPVVLLPMAVFPLRDSFPAWIFMWIFVTALFFGCKWLTWRRAQIKISEAGPVRSFGYLFAWPGMNAKEFLTRNHKRKPKFREWSLALGRFFAGAVLIWFAAKSALTSEPIANAWIAMFGLTLFLHFGLFHLVALAWQRAGVAAQPLMKSPLSATSLSDFWGARWNTAFNKLVFDIGFRPLARRAGVVWATICIFAISGVIHELAISVPARGGYGFPFAYFLLQGAGVLFERGNAGRALGLGHGARGWLFMFVLTAVPAYWLFHPTFVRNVILPMLKTIGAT